MPQLVSGARGVCFAILAAILLVTLAACGGGDKTGPGTDGTDSGAGQVVEIAPADRVAARQRDRRRQQAAEAQEQDFTYFRYRIDTASEQPLACFVFSAPLDPELDYSPYVEFRPAFRPALSVEGRELCVGGLTFGSERRPCCCPACHLPMGAR